MKKIRLRILLWLKKLLGIKSPSEEIFCLKGFIPAASDGMIISKDALKENDGKVVPFTFHSVVIGEAKLECLDDGIYATCIIKNKEQKR